MNSNDTEKSQKPAEIPLLEDVVTKEELEIESELLLFEEDEPQSVDDQIPQYDEVLLAMRDSIMEQLENDLQPMVARAVDLAITKTTGRIAKILHKELDAPLKRRIRRLINQHMEAEFGPREQHMDDDKER